MGLFDSMLGGGGSNKKELTKAEAFAGILLAAAGADGHIADEEIASLCTATQRMKLFSNISPNKFGTMMDGLVKILKREGVEKLVERCSEALPDELRETAFANACDIILADGVVEDEEKELVEKLQNELDIPGDRALDIVQVMVIKNRG
jgi:uncharacterized tellurite resistance protein B-like protein